MGQRRPAWEAAVGLILILADNVRFAAVLDNKELHPSINQLFLPDISSLASKVGLCLSRGIEKL